MQNTLGHFPYFVLNVHALMWQNYTLCQSSRIDKYFIPSLQAMLGPNMNAIFATQFYLSTLHKGSGGVLLHEKCPNNSAPDCGLPVSIVNFCEHFPPFTCSSFHYLATIIAYTCRQGAVVLLSLVHFLHTWSHPGGKSLQK